MPAALTNVQIKHLRRLAHARKPVVMVGQAGVSPAVIAELDLALTAHELIKVKLKVGDRGAREAAAADICAELQAACVSQIGNIAVLFRRNPEKPSIKLPS